MTRNDITGDRIASKPASEAFRDGFDRIFGNPAPAGCGQCPRETQYGPAICAQCLAVEPDPPSQCGDCNGTRRVDNGPCPVCAPTDDGPGDEGNETANNF